MLVTWCTHAFTCIVDEDYFSKTSVLLYLTNIEHDRGINFYLAFDMLTIHRHCPSQVSEQSIRWSSFCKDILQVFYRLVFSQPNDMLNSCQFPDRICLINKFFILFHSHIFFTLNINCFIFLPLLILVDVCTPYIFPGDFLLEKRILYNFESRELWKMCYYQWHLNAEYNLGHDVTLMVFVMFPIVLVLSIENARTADIYYHGLEY